ncbi:hypothetical protein AVEN_100505-1 [Araneus ventricosus]|uniref:Uncharacterized protein n=1 Tax=Araneus ventricosus TaxID=182803 RepID=A0A4Y2SC14_ARAVE|nr:hypothetical protein AVEN_100505-1 [Araneus ventricosus]
MKLFVTAGMRTRREGESLGLATDILTPNGRLKFCSLKLFVPNQSPSFCHDFQEWSIDKEAMLKEQKIIFHDSFIIVEIFILWGLWNLLIASESKEMTRRTHGREYFSVDTDVVAFR